MRVIVEDEDENEDQDDFPTSHGWAETGAPGGVEGGDEFDHVREIVGFFEKGVGAEFVGLIDAGGRGQTGENDYGHQAQFGFGADEFEHLKATFAGHDDVEDDEVRPADRLGLAESDEALQVGNPALGGLGDVPVNGHVCLFACRLKKHLVIGVVIYVKHQ